MQHMTANMPLDSYVYWGEKATSYLIHVLSCRTFPKWCMPCNKWILTWRNYCKTNLLISIILAQTAPLMTYHLALLSIQTPSNRLQPTQIIPTYSWCSMALEFGTNHFTGIMTKYDQCHSTVKRWGSLAISQFSSAPTLSHDLWPFIDRHANRQIKYLMTAHLIPKYDQALYKSMPFVWRGWSV